MRKNNYMKIINTCHALFIGLLMLLPLIWLILTIFYSYSSKNSDFLIIYDNFSNFFADNLNLTEGNLHSDFLTFYQYIIGNQYNMNFLLSTLSVYYVYLLFFEFILGLFRRVFNWIMGFIMGGDSF